jgi:hypothetical protein
VNRDDVLAERLLRLIDEGRRTATYKLALLSALIDAAALFPGAASVATRDLAALVLDLYYPQSRVYASNDGITRELRQISMKASSPLRAVLRLRLHGDAAGCRNLTEVRRRLHSEYEQTLDQVEDTFVRYPIPLLQVVGNRSLPFLYEEDWPEGTSVKALRGRGRDRIRWLDNVPDRLVVLGPLLRPLIELHWTRDVARWSKVATEDERLRAHLFGTDRVAPPLRLRNGLASLQDDRCFYCGQRFVRAPQVDHFVAWRRWPNDAVENLVLADHCNGDKSDHLAAPKHLSRWSAHIASHGPALAAIAADCRWPADLGRTAAYVTSTYLHVAPGTPLWVSGKEFVVAEGPVRVP